MPRGPSPPTGESEKGESASAAAPSDLNRKRLRPGVQCEYRRAWAASAVSPGGVFTGVRPAAEAEASPRSSERRSVEYAAEVSCENYVVPGVWENCQVSEDRDGAMWGERRRRRGRRARNEWCVDWTSRRRTFGRVGGRTSRSDDGCAALAGGSPPSSRLNPCSPADALREGTNRSEYTVSRLPPLEVGLIIPRVEDSVERSPRRKSPVWMASPGDRSFPETRTPNYLPSRRNRLAPRGARVASANKRESSGVARAMNLPRDSVGTSNALERDAARSRPPVARSF